MQSPVRNATQDSPTQDSPDDPGSPTQDVAAEAATATAVLTKTKTRTETQRWVWSRRNNARVKMDGGVELGGGYGVLFVVVEIVVVAEEV